LSAPPGLQPDRLEPGGVATGDAEDKVVADHPFTTYELVV
jgi:hypothetical protein